MKQGWARSPRAWLRALLLALQLAWLCLGAPIAGAQEAAQGGPYTHGPSQLVFPELLGGMPRLLVKDYEPLRPGLGVGVKYGLEKPKIYADVYVFNAGRVVIPEGTGDALVVQMFESAMNDIRQMGASGRYRDVNFIGSDAIPLGDAPGARSALRGRFAFTLDGVEVFSHVYGLAVHNHFIKLRFTYQRDQLAEAVPVLAAALRDLGTVLGSNVQ